MYIERINGPDDVKKLNIDELNSLAKEMHTALLTRSSKHPGHVGPDFGIVEATIALHYVFDSPKDKIIFDVSHQTYPHKMLTGRKDAYLYEKNYNDVSAYSNPKESPHDFFEIGHTSTSVTLAAGMAKARDLKGDKENIIALIGDGSLSGGQAFEGFDTAAELGTNFIIIVNDNQQSIAEVHGGIYKNLTELRNTNGKSENNMFKALGFDYVYVDKGNDIKSLIDAFKSVKDTDKPTVVHINTIKGYGYKPAETDKESWHWHMPFDIKTGEVLPQFQPKGESYQEITANYLLDKMKKDKTLAVICAAVPASIGFTPDVRKKAGKQYIDVGIAEEAGISMAAGIAANGGKAVFGTEATFLQRAYDQISQDASINNKPITIIAVDASIYGMNDVTHVGFYDIAEMANIPGVVYLAPSGKQEYLAMLDWSIEQNEHPVVIRVPADGVHDSRFDVKDNFDDIGKFTVTQKGSDVAVIAYGTFYEKGKATADLIEKKTGIKPTVINPGFVSDIDTDLLESLKKDHKIVAALEDGVIDGGFTPKIAAFYSDSDMKVKIYGLKRAFYDMFNADRLLEENGITPEAISDDIAAMIKG